jgi:rhamnosyltransferase subunit B
VLAPMSFFSETDPIVPPPAPWVHAWLARWPLLSRMALRLTQRMTQKWARPIMAFRASRGLPPRGNPIIEGQHSPHLVLALFSKLLAAPQPDWPANVCVTGAVLYNGPRGGELPADLAAFLDSGTPPIVFTLGTSAVASAGDFYETSVAAARALNQRAVLLVGPHARNRPRTLNDQIFLAEFVPHALVFPRAIAIVHQGGAGTTHQALASGRPMIVVPHAHDQPDNARRVTALGVARTIFPKQYQVTRLVAGLRALIAQPEYTRQAQRCRVTVLSEGGAEAAADAIDALVSRNSDSRHNSQAAHLV